MISLSRRFLLGSVAMGAAAPWMARAQDVTAVQEPIRMLYTALEALMRQGKATPFPKRFDTFAPVVDKAYDLDTVLRVSVGPRWATLDDNARRSLLTAFRRFTIATYVANFDSYDGEKFDIQPGMRSTGHDQIVATRIVPAKGDTVRLDYVMREFPPSWRIVDVLLDGTISRVAVQRSDFRGLLGQGDADALIASLQRKTVDLSGGTLHS